MRFTFNKKDLATALNAYIHYLHTSELGSTQLQWQFWGGGGGGGVGGWTWPWPKFFSCAMRAIGITIPPCDNPRSAPALSLRACLTYLA